MTSKKTWNGRDLNESDTHAPDQNCYILLDGRCVGACEIHNGVDQESGKFLDRYEYDSHVGYYDPNDPELVEPEYSHPLLFSTVDPERSTVPPTRAHDSDCGYDLYIDDDYTILPMTHTLINHNLGVQLPPKTWGLLVGRSSNWERMLEVGSAVIDNGYRGPLFARVLNMSEVNIQLYRGDRVAQLILMPMVTPPALFKRELDNSERGAQGFGSTGR